jgi:hypothetical protein
MTKTVIFALLASLSLLSVTMLGAIVVMQQQTADAAHTEEIPGLSFQDCRQRALDLGRTQQNATLTCLSLTGH